MNAPRGLNLDLLNPAGDPEPSVLLAHGFSWVRLVSKPNPHGQGVHPHIETRLAQYKAVGITALVVITNESQGRIPANHHGICQIGNEPDGQPPSSMVMSKSEYVTLFNTYSGTYQGIDWIAAGLCSGDPKWWADIMPQLEDCKGLAVHLYNEPLDKAKILLDRFRSPNASMPLYITEWNPLDKWSIAAYDWYMRTRTNGAFYFCWSDGMVKPFGLVDVNGNPKVALRAFNPVTTAPSTTPIPIATPVLRQWNSQNYWSGRPAGSPIAIVIHTEAGTEAGTQAVFMENASQVSAHFGVALTGQNDQFVQLQNSAWANGIRESGNAWDANHLPNTNPNYLTVSIETEDRGNNSENVTDKQYAAVLADCRMAIQKYPSIKFLLGHRDISPHSRVHCPGARWIESGRFGRLATELGLKRLS